LEGNYYLTNTSATGYDREWVHTSGNTKVYSDGDYWYLEQIVATDNIPIGTLQKIIANGISENPYITSKPLAWIKFSPLYYPEEITMTMEIYEEADVKELESQLINYRSMIDEAYGTTHQNYDTIAEKHNSTSNIKNELSNIIDLEQSTNIVMEEYSNQATSQSNVAQAAYNEISEIKDEFQNINDGLSEIIG
jgi:hypothetical protein